MFDRTMAGIVHAVGEVGLVLTLLVLIALTALRARLSATHHHRAMTATLALMGISGSLIVAGGAFVDGWAAIVLGGIPLLGVTRALRAHVTVPWALVTCWAVGMLVVWVAALSPLAGPPLLLLVLATSGGWAALVAREAGRKASANRPES